MINYIQSNHTNLNFNTDILSKKFLEKTLKNIKKNGSSKEILNICNKNFINSIQIIIHSEKVDSIYLLNYLVGELDKLYKE